MHAWTMAKIHHFCKCNLLFEKFSLTNKTLLRGLPCWKKCPPSPGLKELTNVVWFSWTLVTWIADGSYKPSVLLSQNLRPPLLRHLSGLLAWWFNYLQLNLCTTEIDNSRCHEPAAFRFRWILFVLLLFVVKNWILERTKICMRRLRLWRLFPDST